MQCGMVSRPGSWCNLQSLQRHPRDLKKDCLKNRFHFSIPNPIPHSTSNTFSTSSITSHQPDKVWWPNQELTGASWSSSWSINDQRSYKIWQFIWPTWSYPFWIIFSKAARKCFAQRSWSSASRSVTSCNTPSLHVIMIMGLEHIISLITYILFLQFCIMHVQECYHIFSTCIQIPYPYYIAWTFYILYLLPCIVHVQRALIGFCPTLTWTVPEPTRWIVFLVSLLLIEKIVGIAIIAAMC